MTAAPLAASTLSEYLDALAARQPAPGGGAAAALTLAQAAALAAMVLEYTIGKPKHAEHDAANRARLGHATQIRRDALGLAHEDALAYERLNALRKSAAATREDVATATARAISVPHDVMALAALLSGTLREYPGATNPWLASDVRVAAILAHAACRAARANVEVNLAGIREEDRDGMRSSLRLAELETASAEALAATEAAL